MTTGKRAPLLSRLRDEGPQTYKARISEFHKFITGRTIPAAELKEEQWLKAHRRFCIKGRETREEEGGANA